MYQLIEEIKRVLTTRAQEEREQHYERQGDGWTEGIRKSLDGEEDKTQDDARKWVRFKMDALAQEVLTEIIQHIMDATAI